MSIEKKISPSYWNKIMVNKIEESRQATTNFADVQKVAYAATCDLMSGKKYSKEYEKALKDLLNAADRIKRFL